MASDVERIILQDISNGITPTCQRCNMDNPEFCSLVQDIEKRKLIDGVAYVIKGGKPEPVFSNVKLTPLGKQYLEKSM